MSQNKENRIVNRDISQEMRESYIDYAMSVIVARALPDVRDGLKPVQAKIFITMHQAGLTHSAKFFEIGRHRRRRSWQISSSRRCVGV